jgi:peptidoglycan/LPS O-acetylase OafA/YrhL
MLMGRYSYGLYVFHGIVAYYLGIHLGAAYFGRYAGSHTGGLLLQALVGSVISIIISVASYHAYETPFLRLKRKFSA